MCSRGLLAEHFGGAPGLAELQGGLEVRDRPALARLRITQHLDLENASARALADSLAIVKQAASPPRSLAFRITWHLHRKRMFSGVKVASNLLSWNDAITWREAAGGVACRACREP
jgi:hypothetical protein